jgi:hypothetical protein
LAVGYFHLVFTLPHELNRLILAQKKMVLSLLFEAFRTRTALRGPSRGEQQKN